MSDWPAVDNVADSNEVTKYLSLFQWPHTLDSSCLTCLLLQQALQNAVRFFPKTCLPSCWYSVLHYMTHP